MGALKLLLSKQGIYAIVALLLFGSGVTALYYLKYRPLRNEAITLRAENRELRKQLKTQKIITDAVWQSYFELAKLPRYSIDQKLDGIKVKRGSSFAFTPNAEMIVEEVDPLNAGDSLIIEIPDTIKKRSWFGRQFEKIGKWLKI